MVNVTEKEMSEDEYEEYLDNIYGDVNICGYKYPSGGALKELDPIAFRCGLCEQPIKYECGKCGEIYEEEHEAEDCCKED